jgi:hypothetical protein
MIALIFQNHSPAMGKIDSQASLSYVNALLSKNQKNGDDQELDAD